MTSLVFSDNAVLSFRDRVRPALSVEQAWEELRRACDEGCATFTTEAPWWLWPVAAPDPEISGYLTYGGDVCFPLFPANDGENDLVVTTCRAHGTIPPEVREFRRDRRRSRAARRRGAKNNRIPNRRHDDETLDIAVGARMPAVLEQISATA